MQPLAASVSSASQRLLVENASVVRTPPGAAQFLAAAIDRSDLTGRTIEFLSGDTPVEEALPVTISRHDDRVERLIASL